MECRLTSTRNRDLSLMCVWQQDLFPSAVNLSECVEEMEIAAYICLPFTSTSSFARCVMMLP